MKRHNPGCICCGIGYAYQAFGRPEEGWRLLRNIPPPPVIEEPTDAVGAFTIDFSALTTGSPVAIGLDVQRGRLLIQKTSNGEVLTVRAADSTAVELLWASTSYAATKEIMHAKYYPDWGFGAIFWDETTHWEVASVDADGDLVNGPYEMGYLPPSWLDIDVDDSGNIYYRGIEEEVASGAPDGFSWRWWINKNADQFGYVEVEQDSSLTPGPFGPYGAGVHPGPACLFSDGTEIYVDCWEWDAAGDVIHSGMWQVGANDFSGNFLFDWEEIWADLGPPSYDEGPGGVSYYNSRTERMRHTMAESADVEGDLWESRLDGDVPIFFFKTTSQFTQSVVISL